MISSQIEVFNYIIALTYSFIPVCSLCGVPDEFTREPAACLIILLHLWIVVALFYFDLLYFFWFLVFGFRQNLISVSHAGCKTKLCKMCYIGSWVSPLSCIIRTDRMTGH